MAVSKKSDLEQLISDIHSYGINHHTREIYVHGAYAGSQHAEDAGEPGVEYRMATAFVKNLHVLEAQNQNNVLLHLHSIGGEWGDGMRCTVLFDMSKLQSQCLRTHKLLQCLESFYRQQTKGF